MKWRYTIPTTRSEYEKRVQLMQKDPDHTKWWFGQTYRYWADALEQTEEQEFLALQCPALVVVGSEDIECASTDRLVQKAHSLKKQVEYVRVEGMGHEVLQPEWNVMDKIIKFIKHTAQN